MSPRWETFRCFWEIHAGFPFPPVTAHAGNQLPGCAPFAHGHYLGIPPLKKRDCASVPKLCHPVRPTSGGIKVKRKIWKSWGTPEQTGTSICSPALFSAGRRQSAEGLGFLPAEPFFPINNSYSAAFRAARCPLATVLFTLPSSC